MLLDKEPRTIPGVLRLLRDNEPPPGGVLSVYLDTSPARQAGQAYLLAFRDVCRAIRADLLAEQRDRFEAARAQVERYLTDEPIARHLGVALFAAADPGYFQAVALPRPPIEDIAWSEQPELGPLLQVLDEYERVAVALFDKEWARLFTIVLGAIEERRTIQDDVPGKQATGDWYALAQTRYARHQEDHVLRHAKHTIRDLMELLRTRPFDRLLIGGPVEAVAVLTQQLPRPLRSRLAGTVRLELFASDAEVLDAALPAAAEAERQGELKAVEALIEAADTAHARLGVAPTLAALGERRVYRLLVADDFAGAGRECPTCHQLVAGPERCPTCGGPTVPVSDLRERAIEQAYEQGAGVETVSGEAAVKLAENGGIGAWVRY